MSKIVNLYLLFLNQKVDPMKHNTWSVLFPSKKFKVGDAVGVGCFVDSCRICDMCKADLQQYCTSLIFHNMAFYVQEYNEPAQKYFEILKNHTILFFSLPQLRKDGKHDLHFD